MSEQEALRRRLYAAQFAAWELHLFLDTHPGNQEASDKLEVYEARVQKLRAEYERKYGPIGENMQDTSRYAWISDPWPWEQEDND